MSAAREAVRAAILAAQDLEKAPIEIPEWGGTYYVRALTGAERGELERHISEHAKAGKLRENYRSLVVIASLCDESGARVFEYGDVEALNGKCGKTLERLGNAADKLNKLSDAEIGELAKN